jgi:hypothetical protein
MTTITIRETAATEQGWQAALSFDNEGDFPLVLRDPFADARRRRCSSGTSMNTCASRS